MRKIITVALLLFSTSAFAQSDDWAPVRIPMIDYAELAEYANYKTYDMLTFSFGEEAQDLHGGRYSDLLHSWVSDPANADFKIISEFKSLNITILSFDKGVASFTTDVNAIISVFDKDGKQVYREPVQAAGVKFTTENYKTKDEIKSREKEVFKEAYVKAIPTLLSGFDKKTKNREYTKSEPMLTIKKAKGILEAEEMNAEVVAIQSIKEEDIATYKQRLEEHKDIWANTAANAKGDKASLLKGVALYNLAFLNIFTDDFDGAMNCMGKIHSTAISKDAKAKIGRIYEIYQKRHKPAPQLRHADSYASKVSTDDLLTAAKYFVVDGELEQEDGSKLSGIIRISRKNMHETAPGIVSLDKPDYWVELGDTKLKLSKVKTIMGTDGSIYHCVSRELLKRLYTSAKVDVYNAIFPSESNIFYFQKPGGKLESAPLIGAGKWLRTFFADCPELVSKIEAKEIKSGLEMGRYYGESCK